MEKYLVLLAAFFLSACMETAPSDSFPSSPSPAQASSSFSPEKYVCYRSSIPLSIDGKMDESIWQQAPWTKEFVDIQGDLQPKPSLQTQVKMLWDDQYFYFYGKMMEPHIWGKLTTRDAIIYYDDDFEIFIDPDGDGHNYYELEINALNTLWELLLLRPYRVDTLPKVLFNWNIPDIKTAIHIEGSLNDPSDVDEYWSVEMAIPWSALKELAPEKRLPKAGEQWRVNFSRVDWQMETEGGNYVKKKDPKNGKPLSENNWVWSPTGRINMHMPEQWGYVQFSAKEAGKGEETFVDLPDEELKQALWQLYFQQVAYFKKNGKYTNDLQLFELQEMASSSCRFSPTIYTTPHWFEIITPTCDGKAEWSIRADGKIERLSKTSK